MRYCYKKLLADIREDFKKYAEHSANDSVEPINRLNVLITSPGFFVVANYRFLYWLKAVYETAHNRLFKFTVFILFNALRCICYQIWKVTLKISISNWPEIGSGFYLSNKGGIIIGPKKIGKNCAIQHNVTIGMNLQQHHPEIGSNVSIGENSIVYCRVVGDEVRIENNTVVSKNIGKGRIIKGNPARIVTNHLDS